MISNTIRILSAAALAAIASPTAQAGAGVEGPLLAIPGKVIYENSLASAPAAPWKIAKGTWEAVDGALKGSEKAEDKHPGVLRMAGAVADNLVIQYEFRFTEGAKGSTFSINGPKGHLCRALMTPATFTVQKDDSDHEGPDKAVVFSRQAADLKAGAVWHKVSIEIIGKTMLGKCDDVVAWGENDAIAGKKANIGFTVSGQSVEVRNLKISEASANPAWGEVKEKLPKGKPAPPPAGAAKKKKAEAN